MFNPDPKPSPRSKSDTTEREKRYTCKHCKEYYYLTPTDYKFRSRTAAKKTCGSDDCMVKSAMKFLEKKKESQNKEWKKRKEKGKESLKTITNWKDDLQVPINWIVRKIDEGLPCIAHPTYKGTLRIDAGHYWGRGTCSDLRFHLDNIHGQSSYSNENFGGGPDYLLGLEQRYSKEYAQMVQGLKLKYQGIAKEKFTIDNIKNIYLPIARKIKREIEKGADFTRDQVNEMIGIYK